MQRRCPLSRLVVISLPVLLCLCVLSCKKEKPPFVNTVVQTPHLGIPTDRSSIFSFDLRRLRALDSMQELIKTSEKNPHLDPLFGMRDRIGFDPVNDIDVLVIGYKKAPDDNNPFLNTVFLARGRFPQDPVPMLEALRAWLAHDYLISPPPYTQLEHKSWDVSSDKRKDVGVYTIYSTEARSQYDESDVIKLNFCFPNEHLALFAFDVNPMRSALDTIAGLSPNLGADEFWRGMLSKPNVGAMFWGTGDMSLPKNMGSMTGQATPKQFFYSVNVTPDIAVEAGFVCESIDDAQEVTKNARETLDLLQGQLAFISISAPTLAALPGKINPVAETDTAKLYLRLTTAEMQTISREIAKFEQAQTQR